MYTFASSSKNGVLLPAGAGAGNTNHSYFSTFLSRSIQKTQNPQR